MDVIFVKFQSLLEESYEDVSIGVMLKNGAVLCLDGLCIFEDGDYSIIEQVAAEYDSVDDFWDDVAYREYEELFTD